MLVLLVSLTLMQYIGSRSSTVLVEVQGLLLGGGRNSTGCTTYSNALAIAAAGSATGLLCYVVVCVVHTATRGHPVIVNICGGFVVGT